MVTKEMSEFEALCTYITNLAPCMDDYLYALDLANSEYFISESAVERFAMDTNHFFDAVEAHRKFVHPDDLAILMEDLNKIKRGEKNQHNITYRWLGKNGETIWINCRGRVVKSEDGNSYMIGCINEIGNRPVADNVSGLLETSAIKDVLEDYCANWTDSCILRIGIDGFKAINERFGLEYGDKVLKNVADCIQRSLHPGQEVYRLPSDEFLLLDFARGGNQEAIELYKRIRSAVDDSIEAKQYEAIYTISGGIVSSETLVTPNYDEILKITQFALGEAKKNGKNQVYVFCPEDYNTFIRKRMIRVELRKSIAAQFVGFELFFQPIVHAKNGRLYAAESLLRYRLPSGEMISPMEFIPILEETGLIIPVGKWVLSKAIAMCKEVRETIPNFRVSVNLSYVQILKSSITDEIFEQIRESGMEPESMIMELTESGYLENTPSVKRVWTHLKEFGVSIAIDDFGTGYSNLQSIGNLTPHVVKLDRGFTVKALHNEYENRVMQYVIDMVHSIDLKICVEGIETEEELQQIRQLKPDYIQGYYFGKPCNRETFLQEYVLK